MKTFNFNQLPRCTVDYPLEISPDEIASLAEPVNILLKTGYLLGGAKDLEGTFESLFDIAEEIAEVDACAYLAAGPDPSEFDAVLSRHVPPGAGHGPALQAPAALARQWGKVVHIVATADPRLRPICASWNAASLLAYPLRRDLETVGALVFAKQGDKSFSRTEVKLLWVLATQAETHLAQAEAVKALSFYSYLDPLTHVYNRRYFENQLEKEIYRSRRNGKPFALLMLDLDGFKAYNDRFLHTAGDIALQEFATILHDGVREVDTACRFGGDEFALILVESGADGARDLAARLLVRLSRHLIPGANGVRTERLSASIGIATFPADSFDGLDLVQKADQALYVAKNQGGGRVCLFHEIADLVPSRGTGTDIPIQKIFAAARSVVDMDKFLEILLFTAMQGLNAGRGSIVVIDPDGDCVLQAAVGFTEAEERLAPGKHVPAGPVTSWIFETKQPLVVSGQADMPLPRQLKRNGYRTDSFLSIPLLHDGRLLGALHLTNRLDRLPFKKADLDAFAPVASRIAAILAEGVAFRDNVKSFSTAIYTSLTQALELRFPFLCGHSATVRGISLGIARAMDLGAGDVAAIETAASLHDIGIVGVPGTILAKKRRLSDRELEVARKHPILGAKLLEGLPGMEEARRIVLEHHENFDGSGYPYGRRGAHICLGARVVALAEFFAGITSDRPHRGALTPTEAVQLVRNAAKASFDPAVVAAFVDLPREFLIGNASNRR